ncbi:MAG: hypothetical protein LBN27_08010 [Prevotellaceae bacterium]|jgi:hypothetical protein|nr:hypothetical protein [Prevotellaceae bacterium]
MITVAKRILFILCEIILCGTVSAAQNKSAEYEKLVDYVNCYYTEKYISNKIADINDKDKPNFEKYKRVFTNDVKSYSDINVSIDKSVPKAISVYNAFKKFAGYYPKPGALWQYIDDKKNQFDENWTKTKMIDFLIDLPEDKINFKSYLKNATNLLKTELQKQIPDSLFDEEPKENPDVGGSGKTNGNGGGGNDINWVKILCFIIIAGLFILDIWKNKARVTKYLWAKLKLLLAKLVSLLLLLFQKIKQKNTKTVPVTPAETSDYKGLAAENERLLLTAKQWETNYAKLHTENQQLRQKIRELERQPKPQVVATQPVYEITQPVHEVVLEIKNDNLEVAIRFYSDAILQNETFNRISLQPNDDTVFEVTRNNVGDKYAKYTVYDGAYRRVLKNPDFAEGCEKQKISVNPSNLEIEQGEVHLEDTGKWKVIRKAKIKFV